jgi:hypothetical protein
MISQLVPSAWRCLTLAITSSTRFATVSTHHVSRNRLRVVQSYFSFVDCPIILWGEVTMCGYLPHINRLFVVFMHCTPSCSRNTTVSQLNAMISIVRLVRSTRESPLAVWELGEEPLCERFPQSVVVSTH